MFAEDFARNTKLCVVYECEKKKMKNRNKNNNNKNNETWREKVLERVKKKKKKDIPCQVRAHGVELVHSVLHA